METVQSGDFSITSSHETADEMRQALAVEEPTPPAELPAPEVPETPPPTAGKAPVPEPGERDPKTGQFTRRPTNAEARKSQDARLAQQTWDQREAERRADAAERRAQAAERERDELRARHQPAKPEPPAPPRQQQPPPADPNDPEPDPENLQVYPDGQFDRRYLKDQARWEARQEYKAAEMARRHYAAEDARQRELSTHATAFSERLSAAEAADPGFMARVHPKLADAKPISLLQPGEPSTFANFLAEQVFHAEHPRELMLHLDESEVQRLATLPPLQVVRELAMFDARLGAAPSPAAPAPAAISHARAPIKPLGSSPQAADPFEITDDLPVEEHIRRMNARDRKEGRL